MDSESQQEAVLLLLVASAVELPPLVEALESRLEAVSELPQVQVLQLAVVDLGLLQGALQQLEVSVLVPQNRGDSEVAVDLAGAPPPVVGALVEVAGVGSGPELVPQQAVLLQPILTPTLSEPST